jgi:hypothetical protein
VRDTVKKVGNIIWLLLVEQFGDKTNIPFQAIALLKNRSLSEVETNGISTSLNAQRQKAPNNSVVFRKGITRKRQTQRYNSAREYNSAERAQ